MSWETILSFWFQHNTQIITVLIGLILLLIGMLMYSSFAEPQESAADAKAGTSEQLAQLEASLKKVIAQTGAAGLTGAAAGTRVVDGLEVDGKKITADDYKTLQAALTSQKEQLSQLEAELSASGGAAQGGGGDVQEYLDKIADLEARLAEYEIIEDDIADLSQFKEENAKLKEELEALKGGGGGSAAAADASEPASSGSPGGEEPAAAGGDVQSADPDAKQSEDLVAEFAAAVGTKDADSESGADTADSSASAEPAPAEETKEAPAETASTAQQASAPADAAADEADTPEPGGGFADDVLAEFAAAISGDEKPATEGSAEAAATQTEAGEAPVVAEGINTEAVVAEAANLAESGTADASALEDAPDMEKMAAEASGLTSDKDSQ